MFAPRSWDRIPPTKELEAEIAAHVAAKADTPEWHARMDVFKREMNRALALDEGLIPARDFD